MKAKWLIYALAGVLLALSCSRTESELERISGFVESAPDSALVALDRYDGMLLSDDRNRAEYDYLYAEAFYRNYYFLDTKAEDALLSSCVYFDTHGPALSAIRAWQLLGSVRAASQRQSSGMICQMKARETARKIEMSRMRYAALLLLIVALMATLILYSHARKVQTEKLLMEEKNENDRLMSVAEDLQNRLSSRENKREKGAKVAGVDMLDRLCEQFYVYEGTSNLQPRILKEVRLIVEGLRSDPKTQKALEESLDENHDGIMTRLRASFPKWKEEDFLLYSFVASGFSSTTIAALMEKDKPYVYNRIYRLKGRISSSEDPAAKEFLSLLER